MPETSFSTANQISATEIDQDSPTTETLLNKYKNRDIEVMDAMAKLGGPSSVGAGSDISYEGDVTIAANQTLEGLHYYNNLTINAGITVTVGKYLIILAKGTVTIAGTVNGSGQGMAGGIFGLAVGRPGNNGAGGAGGGGGGDGVGYEGGSGGSCIVGGDSVTGGVGGSLGAGAAATPLTTRIKGGLITGIKSLLSGGAGGGAGGMQGVGDAGSGGAGGGVILIIAPTVNLAGATITATGANGGNGTNAGSGGGGGGGVIYIATKSYTAATSITVAGGAGGTLGNPGGTGGNGVIQIDVFA